MWLGKRFRVNALGAMLLGNQNVPRPNRGSF